MKYFALEGRTPSEEWSIKEQFRLLKKNLNEILESVNERLEIMESDINTIANAVLVLEEKMNKCI